MVNKVNSPTERHSNQSMTSSKKSKVEKKSCDFLKAVLVLNQNQPEVNDVTIYRSNAELKELNLLEFSKTEELSGASCERIPCHATHKQSDPSTCVSAAIAKTPDSQ